MPRTSRERLLDSIADADSSAPTNPLREVEDLDAEKGVHSDMMKLTNPDAHVGAAGEFGEAVRLPWDIEDE